MYEELVKQLKDRAERFDYDGWVETAIILEQAANAIEELVGNSEQLGEPVRNPYKLEEQT